MKRPPLVRPLSFSRFIPLRAKRVDIPFTSFTLKNGLTVIVHEDRKAPVVATSVWHHVGSKNESLAEPGSRTCSST